MVEQDLKPAPRSQMSATWHLKDPKEWNFFQRTINSLNLLQQTKDSPAAPVHESSDKVPFYPVWKQWLWILPRGVMPLAIHRMYMEISGKTWHPIFAFFL